MARTLESDDICSRLDRIKRLCDDLDAAQGNAHKYHEVIERMRVEADLFRQQLATHDPPPDPED
jgi:hypothetical protein